MDIYDTYKTAHMLQPYPITKSTVVWRGIFTLNCINACTFVIKSSVNIFSI